MFDKKSALKCMIILFIMSLGFLVAYLVNSLAISDSSFKTSMLFITLFAGLLLAAIVMTVIYLRLRKQKTINAANSLSEENALDEKEFNDWLTKFEPFTKLSALLTETTNKTFSKFGGLPVVPETFSWPLFEKRPIPFLLQVDFSEINADKCLKHFPTDGLMYVFVDSDCVNFVDVPSDGDYTYKEGKTFKIVFFDRAENLKTASKPDLLKTVYKEFYVSANIVKTYPDVEDCEAVFDIYCDRPVGGLDDAYDAMQWENMGSHMIGGWASYVQSGGYVAGLKEHEDDRWTLLMQISSARNDEKFMWGDCGVLYFYIREKDLKERNFNNVKMDMQCT